MSWISKTIAQLSHFFKWNSKELIFVQFLPIYHFTILLIKLNSGLNEAYFVSYIKKVFIVSKLNAINWSSPSKPNPIKIVSDWCMKKARCLWFMIVIFLAGKYLKEWLSMYPVCHIRTALWRRFDASPQQMIWWKRISWVWRWHNECFIQNRHTHTHTSTYPIRNAHHQTHTIVAKLLETNVCATTK